MLIHYIIHNYPILNRMRSSEQLVIPNSKFKIAEGYHSTFKTQHSTFKLVINVQRNQNFIQNSNAVNPLKNSGYAALEVINSPTFDAKVHRYNPITTEQKI